MTDNEEKGKIEKGVYGGWSDKQRDRGKHIQVHTRQKMEQVIHTTAKNKGQDTGIGKVG